MAIDLPSIPADLLPRRSAISALTLAELSAGPHATNDRAERARRQAVVQQAETQLDPLPFDTEAARAYGRVYATVLAAGQKARGARSVDLLIAATAIAYNLPLYTRNPSDFTALSEVLEVMPVP